MNDTQSNGHSAMFNIQVAESTELAQKPHVYERFKSRLFETLDYRKLDAASSLHNLFRFLEKTVSLLDDSNMRLYKTLVVFKALLDCMEKPNSYEVEYLRVHLSENVTNELARSLAKAICCIRAVVGMKHFHENVVNFWQQAIEDPIANPDPEYLNRPLSNFQSSSLELPFIGGAAAKFVNDSNQELGTSVSIYGAQPDDAVPFESELVRWRRKFVEQSVDGKNSKNQKNNPISIDPSENNMTSEFGESVKMDGATLMVYLEQLADPELALEHVTKVLNSAETNDEIQFELLEIFGSESFELLQMILENRKTIAADLTSIIRRQKLYEADRYAGSVVVQSKRDADLRRAKRKQEKQAKNDMNKIILGMGADERLEMEMARIEYNKQKKLELNSRNNQSAFDVRLMSSYKPKETLPYVFDSMLSTPLSDLDLAGIKYSLPEGSTRRITPRYHEITVPPQDKIANLEIHSVMVNTLDPLGQLAFAGFEQLNQIQSVVFEQAYNTLENLLICAPTGAGKTNIAMLSILKTLKDHCDESGRIQKDAFKIIYIAPMKALATEMTTNFAKRLARIGLKVRELTGDTQLTKKEINETQMLILTPEKWDVVTRKVDDEALTQLVRLLIIDEVHLLHDERGPVIETIVARTLRQMEIYQQPVRIVGLSATLPNYRDVATFLRVDPYKGLFFFDGRFRPIPLTQTFVGVVEPNTGQVRQYMDEACYDKVMEFLRDEHQVLVFVHSRGATFQMANFMVERAAIDNETSLFQPTNTSSLEYVKALKKIKSAKTRELVQLFEKGIGIHNAGLVRGDRLMMEQMFADGHIRLMCCTATLAWGVNLPAHAVIIRGTDVFDANRGCFTDLGILDVQQIFGRAGRPQFETAGHGIIITAMRNLHKYVSMLIRQAPIESKFQTKIFDNLNAEIARGSVTTLSDAIEWLRYSYFYVRARKNPLVYGIDYQEVRDCPDLSSFLNDLCYSAADKLDASQMIRFDKTNNFLAPTDLGRIAAHYMITFESIETFMNGDSAFRLTSHMTETDIISLICLSSEFSQIQCREQEMRDLDELMCSGCALKIKGGGLATAQGKSNCLLQNYISRTSITHSTLSSETLYIAQNASRVARALFEITLRKGWAATAIECLNISKYIQRRLWSYNSPLKQIQDVNLLKEEVVRKVEAKRMSFFELLEFDANDLGQMFRCDGRILYECVRMIPQLEATAQIKPITHTIIRIDAQIVSAFTWNDQFLGAGSTQRFWLIIEDMDTNTILHHEQINYNRRKVQNGELQNLTVTIPIEDTQMRDNFQLRIVSDDWVVEDTRVPLSMNNYVLPETIRPHTDLLDLEPLPISALKNIDYQNLYGFQFFNPSFFSLYHTWDNVLIGAPTSSGKTLCAELAIFRLLQHRPGKKCVYIAPLKALVRERVKDWKEKFVKQLGVGLVEVSGDHTPSLTELEAASILVTTPEKWDGITRSYDTRTYVRDVNLVIIDEIHLLGVERGAVLEAIVTRMKIIARRREQTNLVRLVGLSTALANAGDIADWLGVPESGLYNFRPSVRPVPIDVHIQGFHGQHYCPRMALMNKPAFKAIKQFSPVKPTLVFVASRRQTRLTAMAFVSLLATEVDPKQWLHMEQNELQSIVQTLRDENLKITLPFGIGIHHAGLQAYERSIVEHLFVERKIQVLIATSTLAWGINCPAHLVIVKGTEYYDGKTHKYVDFPVTDVLQMIGRAGRPQYDTSAVAVVYVQDVKKKFYKRFLYEPFPVESSLLPVLPNHVNAEVCSGSIASKQQIIEYLAGTYLYRRLFANPNYYDIEEFSDQALVEFLTSIVDLCINELVESQCLMQDDEDPNSFKSTPFGTLASKYYLEHMTIRHFATNLRPSLSIIEVLQILTNCPEYAEIPVRHNEDNINMEMNHQVRYPMDRRADFESSHTKTNLLYQAWFSRMHVPVDYLTDQRSILESCIRIVQAILDFSIVKGWLNTSLTTIILLQQIIQARWFNDHPLLCLPHMTTPIIEALGASLTVPLLQQELGICQRKKERKQYEDALIQRTGFEEHEAREVVEALLSWPILALCDVQLLHNTTTFGLDPFALFEGSDDRSKIPKMICGQEYRMKVSVQVVGAAKDQENAYTPQYSKDKTAGWILMIGCKQTNAVLSIRKVANVSGTRPQNIYLDFKAPEIPGQHLLTMYIMSDSYLNIDQEYDFNCQINSVASKIKNLYLSYASGVQVSMLKAEQP
ncbi:hypothetical protein M3Y98_00750700 [Aphelenchoides besseyi]|nr:hypothetical protein M3Y98_00750700 [Aphelenchoides besseyi]